MPGFFFVPQRSLPVPSSEPEFRFLLQPRRNRLRCLAAKPLAIPANLHANPAMLMFAGVTCTFVAAQLADLLARLEHLANSDLIRPGAPRRDGPGGDAQIGAIHVEADALRQFLHFRFAKAGIRAGDAGLRAIETFVDAMDQCVIRIAAHMWMRGDHSLRMHLDLRPD